MSELKEKVSELLAGYWHLHDIVTGGDEIEEDDIYYEVKALLENKVG